MSARVEAMDAYLGTRPPAKRRFELSQLVPKQPRQLAGTYDAARSSDDFDKYWANADSFDADSANSKEVRHKLIKRSRYEADNNGYVDGIIRTYATDMVGVGPTLRMQTGSAGFNQMVELAWYDWAKAAGLSHILWCMAMAKVRDGEAFAIIRNNPRLKNPVKLFPVVYEAEQCQTPYLAWGTPNQIDGITFDEFGNPLVYEFLKQHPGSNRGFVLQSSFPVDAEYVLHWFTMRRPGQHRGIPELTSTLQVGAASRRFREAVVAAAETAADFAALLHTDMAPDDLEVAQPFSTIEFQKRMMVALPNGYEPTQMKAEHPNALYTDFLKQQISETARPLSMPLNKAACDSSDYNYASGRLDHQTYYAALDIERERGNCLLDKLFSLWFDEAVRVYGWLGGNPAALSPAASYRLWDWPKHPVVDLATETTANDSRLRNGSLSLTKLYADNGQDFEDELPKLAADLGKTPDEMRAILLNSLFNNQNQQASMLTAAAQAKVAESNAKQPAPAQPKEAANAA